MEYPLKGRYASMFFIVPHQRSGLDDIIASFSPNLTDFYDVIQNKMALKRVTLQMPLFQFTYNLDLTKILPEMGIQKIFGPEAELSRMFDPENRPNDLDTNGHCDKGDEDTDGSCSEDNLSDAGEYSREASFRGPSINSSIKEENAHKVGQGPIHPHPLSSIPILDPDQGAHSLWQKNKVLTMM